MKKKIISFYKQTASKRHGKKNIFLTIVALVEILAILVISTSAWVETISSIKIYTSGSVDASGTKGIIESALNHQVGVSDSGSEIDLTKFFRPSGGYHLSPASSADGENIFFPETNITNHSTTNYRVATINDKNVNYVSFTVKVTTANNFAFDSVPTIKVGGTTISNNLVRFSIGYAASSDSNAATDFKIYGMTANSPNEEVVSAVDGTKSNTTVRAFSDYVKGNNKVITTVANSYLTINMWIQDDASYTSASAYSSKAVEVSNFKLVPVYPLTAKAVSNNVVSGDGGSVAINNISFGATVTSYCQNGQTITLKASPNTSKAFQFLGWTTSSTSATYNIVAASGCTLSGSTYSYSTYTFDKNVATIYAKFSDSHDLYFKPEFKHPDIPNNNTNGTYAAYLWQWNPSTSTLVKQWKVMTYVSSGTWSGYYKCTYQGSATNVIFCYMNPNYRYYDGTTTVGPSGKTVVNLTSLTATDIFNTYKYLQTYDLVFPPELGEYGYIATSRYTESTSGKPTYETSYVMGYWKDNYSRVTATADTGGSISTVYLAKSTTSASSVSRYGTNSNSEHYVNLDGRKYNGNANGEAVTDHYNKEVTLVASVNAGYKFDGWYLNGQRVSTDLTCTVVAPDNPIRGSGTVYSSNTYTAKFKLTTTYTTDSNDKSANNTIVLWDGYKVGNNNYTYINMYESGQWGTGYVSMTNTNYGKDYKNLYFYVLPSSHNISESNTTTVEFSQDSNGSNKKYLKDGLKKYYTRMVTSYGNGNDMNYVTYSALVLDDIYYPSVISRGDTVTFSACGKDGCPKYISDEGYSGSGNNYGKYTLSYSVKNSSNTEVSKGTMDRTSTSGTNMSKTWATSSSLATGSYTVTFTLTDGVETITSTKNITVVEQ